jgi:hypothetical protein
MMNLRRLEMNGSRGNQLLVGALCAISAALLTALVTTLLSGRGEYLPLAVHLEYDKRVTDEVRELGDHLSRVEQDLRRHMDEGVRQEKK